MKTISNNYVYIVLDWRENIQTSEESKLLDE